MDTYSVTIIKRGNGAKKTYPNVLEEYDLDHQHCLVLDEFTATGNLRTMKHYHDTIDHIATEHRPHPGTTKPKKETPMPEPGKALEVDAARGCNGECPFYHWDSADEAPTCVVDDGKPDCYLTREGGGSVLVKAKRRDCATCAKQGFGATFVSMWCSRGTDDARKCRRDNYSLWYARG